MDFKSLTRRTILGASGGGLFLTAAAGADQHRSRYQAMAFDALAVFDPSPVAARAAALFPGRGAELTNLWRTRQFEYTWLRTITGRYRDFMGVTEDALVFSAAALNLALSTQQRDELLDLFLHLRAWPEAAPALRRLKAAGVRLALLSNFTRPMLDGAIADSGLSDVFEQALSTDAAQTYKPDARAYQLGVDTLALPRQEILFVAFAGWDAAGAKTFGYPTFWVNRLGLPGEELGVAPDGAGRTLADLEAFVRG